MGLLDLDLSRPHSRLSHALLLFIFSRFAWTCLAKPVLYPGACPRWSTTLSLSLGLQTSVYLVDSFLATNRKQEVVLPLRAYKTAHFIIHRFECPCCFHLINLEESIQPQLPSFCYNHGAGLPVNRACLGECFALPERSPTRRCQPTLSIIRASCHKRP